MAFGSAFHVFCLEGTSEYNKHYVTAPVCDRRTKEGKAIFEEFSDQINGRDVISATDFSLLQTLRHNVEHNEVARGLLDSATHIEYMREGIIEGVEFKGVADVVGDHWVADLKTVQDASPERFQRDCYSMGYHMQAAIYRLLFGVDRFYWICVEKNAPHNVCVYQQSDRAARAADQTLRSLIQDWKQWDGSPASYANKAITLDLPRWAV